MEDSAAICAEYSKFNEYCYHWWWARLREGYDGNPRAVEIDQGITDDSVEVSRYLNNQLMADVTGHTVSGDDVIRYGAVMEDFVMQMRSSGSEALWYNGALMAGWS